MGGKVVAVTFICTRCSLPTTASVSLDDFSQLNRRFAGRMGHDLVYQH